MNIHPMPTGQSAATSFLSLRHWSLRLIVYPLFFASAALALASGAPDAGAQTTSTSAAAPQIREKRAATVRVGDLPALQRAIAASAPGDRIVVAGGVYTSPGAITINKAGAAGRPVTIAAETVGGVELTGEGGFRLESPAAYVVIEGFKFTHAPGTLSLGAGVHHCRISRNVFELAGTRKGAYLQVSGDDNEISYNTFQNKHTEGQMISVQGPGSSGMAQRTWIHHNYFYNFRPSSNNCGRHPEGRLSRRRSQAAYRPGALAVAGGQSCPWRG